MFVEKDKTPLFVAIEKDNINLIKFFLEKTKAINWLGEKEKEQIKKFILLITTAYDYNEYVNFLDKIFSGQNEITIESKSLETEKKYNEELSNACRVFKNLEPLREKILTNNISFSTNNLPQPTSADDVWQHLLNSGNYYEQKSLKDNLLKVKDFISKKWNSTEEFENFNVFIKNCMYLSDHDQKEILNEKIKEMTKTIGCNGTFPNNGFSVIIKDSTVTTVVVP